MARHDRAKKLFYLDADETQSIDWSQPVTEEVLKLVSDETEPLLKGARDETETARAARLRNRFTSAIILSAIDGVRGWMGKHVPPIKVPVGLRAPMLPTIDLLGEYLAIAMALVSLDKTIEDTTPADAGETTTVNDKDDGWLMPAGNSGEKLRRCEALEKAASEAAETAVHVVCRRVQHTGNQELIQESKLFCGLLGYFSGLLMG